MMREQVSVMHMLLVVLYFYPILAKQTSYQLNSTQGWFIMFKKCLNNHVRIEFMPGVYEVEEDILITNVNNISIMGDSSSTPLVTFTCSNLSSWIITNSSLIEIKNIRFLNCGKGYDAQFFEGMLLPDQIKIIKATIFMHSVSTIRMTNVTIWNSCGYGIIALNIVGMCTFKRIFIHGNNSLGTFCDSRCTILGGMALLNFKMHGVEAIQKDTLINVKECLFSNIRATQIVETDYTYLNSSIITIFLHQVNYHIDINIEHMNITNVTIAQGSIISISYSTNSTQ